MDIEEATTLYAATTSPPLSLDGGVAVAWTGLVDFSDLPSVFFSILRDDGSFAQTVLRESVLTDSADDFDAPRIAGHGQDVLVLWYRRRFFPDSSIEHAIEWCMSGDKGATWTQPQVLMQPWGTDPGPAVAVATDGTFYACATHEKGDVLLRRLDPRAMSWVPLPQPFLDTGVVLGRPSVAVRPSGTVGLAMNVSLGSRAAVAFAESSDRGETWTDFVQVSPFPFTEDHSEPHLSAGNGADWHLVWLGPGAGLRDILYIQTADDSALTWTKPVRVNPVRGSVPVSMPETIAMTTDRQGHVYVAYPFHGDGTGDIHVMTTRQEPFDENADLPFYTVSALPNPFRGSTVLQIPTPGPDRADFILYDVAGRLVRAWRALELSRGLNAFTWDGRRVNGTDVPAGVYYWEARIESANAGPVTRRGRIVRVAE